VLLQRQSELAKLDELDIVLDTDPSEVNGGGASQAFMQMGAEPAFEDTQPPAEEEGYEELSVLEDPVEEED